MRGRADHLDSARMRLMIRLGALETGQEAVMDVDAAPGEIRRHIVGQYLHIARQHDQIGPGVLHNALYRRFLLRFCRRRDGEMMEWNIPDHRGVQRRPGMIGDDGDDIHRQLTGARAVKQVTEAMIEFGDHHQHALAMIGRAQLPVHAALVREHREASPKLGYGRRAFMQFK